MSNKVEQENNLMKLSSGWVTSQDKLVSFIYILLRDHVPAATVEEIVRNHTASNEEVHFTNGWLAEYAKYVAERLKP